MQLKKVSISFDKMHSTVDSLIGVVRGTLALNNEKEYKVRLVTMELLTNILSYSGADEIMMSAALEKGILTLTIEDNGEGFGYEEIMARDVTNGEYLMQESGRGIFLVRMMADGVQFDKNGRKVTVRLNLR